MAGAEALTRIITPSLAVPSFSSLWPWLLSGTKTLLSAHRTIHSNSLPNWGNCASNLGSRLCCNSTAASIDVEEPNITLWRPVGNALWIGLALNPALPLFILWPKDRLLHCRWPNSPFLPTAALDMGSSVETADGCSSDVTSCFTGL